MRTVPALVALLAKTVAAAAEEYWAFFKLMRTGRLRNLAPFTMERWQGFYREPRTAGRAVWHSLKRSLPSLRRLVLRCRQVAKAYRNMSPFSRVAWGFWQLTDVGQRRADLAAATMLVPAVSVELHAGSACEDPGASQTELSAEVQFFVTVWLPSMLLLGTDPAVLFEEAASGKVPACVELIRLDPFAADLPAIQSVRLQLLRDNDAGGLEAIRLAQAESIELPERRAKFKGQLAAKVIRFSQQYREIVPLTSGTLDRTDMWNLFDLQARSRGQAADADDLKSVDAYKKDVERTTSFFPSSGWDIFF
jgi:hypothetical protein